MKRRNDYHQIIAETLQDIAASNRAERVKHLQSAALAELEMTLNRYTGLGYGPALLLAIAIKKSQWILEAATKKEIQAILNPQAPRYDGNKFYPDKYMPPEEEAICWCALPLHEACQIMYLSGFPAENWQDTLPDEGGTVTNGFGMELSEHLFRKNLDFAWERKFITSEGLWLVGVSPNHKGKVGPVTIGGAEVNFDELKSEDELLNFLIENDCTHTDLMEFCEDYKKRYGNDLCWLYPIGDSSRLGECLVLVREGVLSLPYTFYLDNANLVFELSAASLLHSEQLVQLSKDWVLFSADLQHAMSDMEAYLRNSGKLGGQK